MLSVSEACQLIIEVLDYHRDLTYDGFAAGGGPKRSLAQRAAEIRHSQERMLTSHAIEEFLIAYEWLDRQPRTENVNKRAGTSYSFKHEFQSKSGGYVSNGMFIAAAIGSGYVVERAGYNSQNAWLNISQFRASNPNLHMLKPHPRAMRLINAARHPSSRRPGSARSA